MKIISNIINKIFKILIIFIIFLSIVVLVLKNGIAISNLNIADVDIKELYIKLDKKLIVSIKNMEIPIKKSSESSNSKEEFLKLSKKIIWLDRIFKEINIKNLALLDNNITILYKDDILYVDNKYLKIDSKIASITDGIDIKLNELSFKDFNATLMGNLDLNLKKDIYKFKGSFKSHEITGETEFSLTDDFLDFKITRAHASSLKNFMQELGIKAKLDDDVKNWIYGYVIAKEYLINNLRITAHIKNGEIILENIDATGFASDLTIKINQKLPPVKVDDAFITLFDGNIHFDLTNPTYKEKKLNGSKIKIYNVFDENSGILIDIKTQALFDKDISEILKAFDINIPVIQKTGKMNADLNIDINFKTADIVSKGKFFIKDTKLSIAGADFYSKSANIELNRNKVFLKNVYLLSDIFEAEANGTVDITKMNAKFDTHFKKIRINADKKAIIDIKNYSTPITLDFSKKDTLLSVEKLKTDIVFAPKSSTITINQIKDILQYSPLLNDLSIENADIFIVTSDFSNFDIDATNVQMQSFLLHKDKKPYSLDDINIKVKKDSIIGRTKSGLINFNIDKKSANVNIKDLDFIIDTGNAEKESQSELNLRFTGNNSSLILKDVNKTLAFDFYSGYLDKKDIKFDGKMDNGDVNLILSPTKIALNAKNITDKSVNSIIGSQSFEKGNFNLKILGQSPKYYKGEILIKDTFMKDYILYQRLLSFLNSIPSLFTFKTPDFNDKGFTVKDGKIYFTRKEDIVEITALDFLGSSADIGGKGTINLKTEEINIDLELKYLKDASSIIDKIPLVNQIILGKDRTISTVIEIRGTLKNPTYKTQVITDVLKTPFSIIKNTLELPFVIFE